MTASALREQGHILPFSRAAPSFVLSISTECLVVSPAFAPSSGRGELDAGSGERMNSLLRDADRNAEELL
jgi:hypothetical protein